jgi:hypothetical protein
MTVHLTEFTNSMESTFSDGGIGVSDCQTQYGPAGYWGPEWTDFSCTLHFTQGHLSTTMSGLVRPSGEGGTATTTAILSTGESASFTTDFNRLAEPPPPPAAIPGPAAAPTKTVTETFTQAGEAEPESTSISPSAETAQIALSWPESKSSFDVTGITLVAPSGRVVAQAERRPLRLKIKKIRGRHSLDVRIKHLRRGRLRFKIVATKLAKATRVLAKIRQSKR